MELGGGSVDTLGLVWLTLSHFVAWADEASGGVVTVVGLWVISESVN